MKIKAIKITADNKEKIQGAIDAVQTARHSVRTINAEDVLISAGIVEKQLLKILYKKDWAGLTVDVDPNAQKFPGAYKGTPESTSFIIEARATGLFLVAVRRMRCDTAFRRIYGIESKAERLAAFVKDNF